MSGGKHNQKAPKVTAFKSLIVEQSYLEDLVPYIYCQNVDLHPYQTETGFP